jgi:hypothetical protein
MNVRASEHALPQGSWGPFLMEMAALRCRGMPPRRGPAPCSVARSHRFTSTFFPSFDVDPSNQQP